MTSSAAPLPDARLIDLQATFALTRSEAEVALAMVRGASLRQIAEARGVSINTVRNQVKSAMAKTATRRQIDLVLVVDRRMRG